MPSKFDRLRAGEVVEIEPGRKGRLNLENKSFETSDGRTMFVGDDPDFFPSGDNALAYSREKEGLQREIKSTPAGEFLYQFGNQGIAGATKDWYNKLTKKGDDYLRSKQVNQEVSEGISESSPWTSGAATAASFIPDIALTKGMRAATAAPALAAIHAGPRIIEEPAQVAGEALISAAGGHLIDKGASALNRIAQRRGQVRALPGQQQAVSEANALQNEEFNALRQNVKSVNEAKLKQHQDDLNSRQNTIIQEKNAYEQRKLQRDSEVIRLKNKAELEKAQRASSSAASEAEYRTAKQAADQENARMTQKFKADQEQYNNDLRRLPEMQKQAQQEYSKGVVENADKISKAFPENSKIFSSQLGAGQFIEDSIEKSGLAGTKVANQSSRILKSIFPEGEILSGKELSRRYRALEEAIQNASPEVRTVLNDFKTHMGERLPSILADNMAYNRIVPTLRTSIEREVSSILDKMALTESGHIPRSQIKAKANFNLKNIFNELTPEEFIQKIHSGELRETLLRKIINFEDFSGLTIKNPGKLFSGDNYRKVVLDPAKAKIDEFRFYFEDKLNKALAKAELKLVALDSDVATKLGAKVRKTYGMAQPVAPPVAPVAAAPIPTPQAPPELPGLAPVSLPGPVAPPIMPSMPGKPSLLPEPMAPSQIPAPNLAPAQGMAERAGDFLEKPILGGGQGVMNNPLLKLGGLKYLLGKAALPAEAAYLGMKGLTSPTAAGQAARASFKQAGIQAIDMWAQRYPSYHNGILENPQERRSLTKEIEDDPEIPLEQKAVIQSKINRGKPLQDRL